MLVIAILGGGYFLLSSGKSEVTETPTPTPTQKVDTKTAEQPVSKTPVAPKATGPVLNAATVALHSKESDCWYILNNKVYDVTKFVPAHPGGSAIMVPFCGKEATQAFNTKGVVNNPHSETAIKMLDSYLVGNLVI